MKNWYWIVLSISIGLFLAWLYIRYAVPIYRSAGNDFNQRGFTNLRRGFSEEAILQDLALIQADNNINNEIQILKSRTLMEEVVEDLGLDKKYEAHGRIKTQELYDRSFIKIDTVLRGKQRPLIDFEILALDNSKFKIIEESESSIHFFSQPLILENDTVFLKLVEPLPDQVSPIKISIRPLHSVANRYMRKLKVKQAVDYTSVLSLEIEDPVARKATDIISKLIELYNQSTINDKNQVSKKTLDFIQSD